MAVCLFGSPGWFAAAHFLANVVAGLKLTGVFCGNVKLKPFMRHDTNV